MNRTAVAAAIVIACFAGRGVSRPCFGAETSGLDKKQEARMHLEAGDAALRKGDYSSAKWEWTQCLLLSENEECFAKLNTYKDRETPQKTLLPELLSTHVVIDLARAKRYGPYMLVTHSGRVYPASPVILIQSKDKNEDPAKLKSSIAERLKTDVFNDAMIIPVDEFFPEMMKRHPEDSDRIKRDQAATLKDFRGKKVAAEAWRLGTNETESFSRP